MFYLKLGACLKSMYNQVISYDIVIFNLYCVLTLLYQFSIYILYRATKSPKLPSESCLYNIKITIYLK